MSDIGDELDTTRLLRRRAHDLGVELPDGFGNIPRPHSTASRPVMADVRTPETAATVEAWARIWLAMCADPRTALGPFQDDDAPARYGVSARQLRRIRTAALSSRLRDRAQQLGVTLPAGFVDDPAQLPDEESGGDVPVRVVLDGFGAGQPGRSARRGERGDTP